MVFFFQSYYEKILGIVYDNYKTVSLQSIYKKKKRVKKSTKTLKISFYNFKLFAYHKVVQKVMI